MEGGKARVEGVGVEELIIFGSRSLVLVCIHYSFEGALAAENADLHDANN